MKKVAFLAIMAMSISQTGCVIVSDDEETGQFDVGWTLTQGGAEVSCADVGVATVRVQSISSGGTNYIDLFDCVDNAGLTQTMPLDDYTVSAQVLDALDNNLSDYVPMDASLLADGDVVQLDYQFAFTPAFGDVVFSVDYGDAGGSNCVDNGVVQQEVWLTGVGSTECIAYPLYIDDPYAVDGDTCGTTNVCMENTVAQTIQGVDAGDYTLTVFGLKGAVGPDAYYCYTYQENITVDGDIDLGTIAVPWNPLPEDDAACNATKP